MIPAVPVMSWNGFGPKTLLELDLLFFIMAQSHEIFG
jgi:hypothetical protein